MKLEVNFSIPDQGKCEEENKREFLRRELKDLLKNDNRFFIHYQNPFIEWLKSLAQLRAETLIMYNLN